MPEKTAAKFDLDQLFTGGNTGARDRRVLAIFALGAEGYHMSEADARAIIELNIRHYRDLLKRENDAAKRRTIQKLLAEEEAKLVKLSTPGKDK